MELLGYRNELSFKEYAGICARLGVAFVLFWLGLHTYTKFYPPLLRHAYQNLEENAPWVPLDFRVKYKDTDCNGKYEAWYKDPNTGKEYKLVLEKPTPEKKVPAR
jgi:hypothetical protein